MSIFVCDKCGCIDNTATTRYWMRCGGFALCSECDPAIGKWHGLFDRRQYDSGRDEPINRPLAPTSEEVLVPRLHESADCRSAPVQDHGERQEGDPMNADWPWWEQYDEVADELDKLADDDGGSYVVTFWERPDQTGWQVHVYTWAADSPEQAVEFAHRQLERVVAAVYSTEARKIVSPSLMRRAADDIRTLTDGLKQRVRESGPSTPEEESDVRS